MELFFSSFLMAASLSMVTNCIDDLGAMGESEPLYQASSQPLIVRPSRGLQAEAVNHLFYFPSRISAAVAEVYRAPNIRVFALADRSLERWEAVEIWGYDLNPEFLGKIYLDPVSSQVHPLQDKAVEIPDIFALIGALKDDLLLNHLNALGFIPSASQTQKERYYSKKIAEIHKSRESFSGNQIDEKKWESIFEKVYRKHFESLSKKQLTKVFLPQQKRQILSPLQSLLSGEGKIEFSDYLKENSKAVAVLETDEDADVGARLRIFLHPVYSRSKTFGKGFPSLKERIEWEKSFQLEWLQVKDPILVEVVSSDKSSNNNKTNSLIVVFSDEKDIPEGQAFNRIDPKTGWR